MDQTWIFILWKSKNFPSNVFSQSYIPQIPVTNESCLLKRENNDFFFLNLTIVFESCLKSLPKEQDIFWVVELKNDQ